MSVAEDPGTRRLTIEITFKERVASLLRGGVLAGLGLLVIGRTMAVAFEWERFASGQEQLVERWVFFFSGLLIGMIPIPLSFPLFRPAFARRAHLEIRDHWTNVRRDGLLPDRFIFQRSDVRAVFVGELGELRRDRGWLYPLLASASVRPNVGIVFHGTVEAHGALRGVKGWPGGGSSYLPVPRSRTSGLLLRMNDPDAAADTLRAWAGVDGVDPDDLEPVKPSDYEWSSRRFAVYLGYAVVVALACLHLFNVIAHPEPDACDARAFSCADEDGS